MAERIGPRRGAVSSALFSFLGYLLRAYVSIVFVITGLIRVAWGSFSLESGYYVVQKAFCGQLRNCSQNGRVHQAPELALAPSLGGAALLALEELEALGQQLREQHMSVLKRKQRLTSPNPRSWSRAARCLGLVAQTLQRNRPLLEVDVEKSQHPSRIQIPLNFRLHLVLRDLSLIQLVSSLLVNSLAVDAGI